MNKIFPCLWFDGNALEAAQFYCSVFKNATMVSQNSMVIIFEINETKFMALNGGPQYTFTPANSYVIECENQEEIDHYWAALGAGGIPGQCGWLDDKFGVSWQIVPSILAELMRDSQKAPRVIQAFMQMTKFNIEQLLHA